MATGTHVATVAFSARNVLAMAGAMGPEEIRHALATNWNPRVELGEVQQAIARLLERKMIALVEGPHGVVRATDPRVYNTRGANGQLELTEDDPRAWEGWRRIEGIGR